MVEVQQQFVDREKRTIAVGDNSLRVELVKTPESMARGLSGRKQIGADGMLFLLPQQRIASFWMKEMEFDLDMIWIADNKVVYITEKVPKPSPGTKLDDLPLYSSTVPVDMVLEVNAGQAALLQIAIGDQVTIY